MVHATNHHVDTSTSATNVLSQATQATQAPNVLHPSEHPTLVPHSVLKPTNPLPNGITTPVNIENFSSALRQHPEQELCKYLIDGLTNGFDIGYT